MTSWWTASVLGLAALAAAQQIGTAIPEVHPKLTTFTCTTSGGCVEKKSALVTDALSRPLHAMGNMDVSCATMPFDATLCPDAETCAKNCVLEGVEYGSIGVLASGSALTLRQYINNGTGFAKVSPRLYLLAEDEQNYEMLRLVNQELTYDVDMSEMVCGMNGALYLSEMEASGSRTELNPAGATYGTGKLSPPCRVFTRTSHHDDGENLAKNSPPNNFRVGKGVEGTRSFVIASLTTPRQVTAMPSASLRLPGSME
jgi:cellulase